MQQIVIIGGGLSGTLLLLQLLKTPNARPLQVTVVEKDGFDGLGPAYNTDEDYHLLNVPAANMSLDTAHPADFLEWLHAEGHVVAPQAFVPRRLFRQYVKARLAVALAAQHVVRVHFIKEEACDILMEPRAILLGSNALLPFDQCVLAMGFPAPACPGGNVPSQRYFPGGLPRSAFPLLEQCKTLFIAGTGLSMVDTVLALHHYGYRSDIIAMSAHGWLPQPHFTGAQATQLPTFTFTPGLSLSMLFRQVRAQAAAAAKAGLPWQTVIDAMRPVTQQLWQQLPPASQRQFARHLRHIWNSCRHRVPATSAAILSRYLQRGQLQLWRGRVRAITTLPQGQLRVHYNAPGLLLHAQTDVDLVVNCLGPASNVLHQQDGLLPRLVSKGIAALPALSLGIACTTDGRVIDQEGNVNPRLFVMGALMQGQLWEVTAVPEIREQARYRAGQLIACHPLFITA